ARRGAGAVPRPRACRQRAHGGRGARRDRTRRSPFPARGNQTMTMLVLFLLVTIAAGMAGGALGGLKLAGADLGNQLAAMMGAFYGTLVSVPAAILATVILHFLQRG